MTKKNEKRIFRYSVYGGILGLFADILLNFAGMDVYNIFYTPLHRLIPIDAVVPLVFIIIGAVLGGFFCQK